jgi:photosystem II stability/assembly factor-like uncharacterized protein
MKARRLYWFAIGLALLLTPLLLASPASTQDPQGVHLNMIFNRYLPFPLALTSAWTTDAAATPTAEFTGGEPIQYHASGAVSGDQPIQVDRAWTLNNYCGETLVYTDTVSLDPGDWTAAITQTLPACSGVSNYTFQATFDERPLEITTPFTVTNPVTPAVWARAAFDKCDNPSISQMQTWWTYSPYWISNIYIGGVSRACDNLDLTPEWVRAVLDQGWALIPTWVGPQAPCSRFLNKFSYDLTEAYLQGRAEADAAALEAAALGLTSSGASSTIIYYDLEGYSQYVTSACRAAAKSFVNGWVERMHELGNPAGVYGGACSSYMIDWATIPNVPNDVWIADWYLPYEYDPDATVYYEVSCVSDSLWNVNQRLRQYAGDHNETWGSLSMNIDSSITKGQVLALLPTLESVDPARLERSTLLAGPAVESIGALSAEQAWIVVDGRLYWTADGGISWSDRSPEQASVQAATFLNEAHGWLVSAPSAAQPSFTLWRTTDGGLSWQAAPFAAGGETLLDARAVSLDFISPIEGWLAFKLPGSANFNLGVLYHTADGGLTWEELSLPGGGSIDFITQNHGWTLAGPQGDQLFQTQDGGRTWQPLEAEALAPLGLRDPLRSSLPKAASISYVNSATAWAFTRMGECYSQVCTTGSALWRTLDGGLTWVSVALPASP